MEIERVILERQICSDEHLCAKCDRIYELRDGYPTTQWEHPCKYAELAPYKDVGVEVKDNGSENDIIKCPGYKKINTGRLYKTWMASEDWKRIAREKIKQAHFKCELCGSAINLHVHHITYENLCREDRHMDDLLVVCNKCHLALHEEDMKRKDQQIEQGKPPEDLPKMQENDVVNEICYKKPLKKLITKCRPLTYDEIERLLKGTFGDDIIDVRER